MRRNILPVFNSHLTREFHTLAVFQNINLNQFCCNLFLVKSLKCSYFSFICNSESTTHHWREHIADVIPIHTWYFIV